MGITDFIAILTDFNFDLADYLPSYSLAQVAPFFWLSFLCSWIVCYLVHLPDDTRLLRRTIWPIAVASNLFGVLSVDNRGGES
jgi:hypothetical protein